MSDSNGHVDDDLFAVATPAAAPPANLAIERVAVASLSLDPANVRQHGERNAEAIAASLRRFGQQKPVVVDAKGIVVAGNGTLAAAKALGWDHIDIVRTALIGSEAVAFAIADNRTSDLSTFDTEALDRQLRALIDEGIPLDDVGFLESELFEVPDIPDDNKGIDEAAFAETEHECPKCGFKW